MIVLGFFLRLADWQSRTCDAWTQALYARNGPVELKVTRYEVDDAGVAVLRLHRPDRGNSWTGRMHEELRHVCALLEADERVRVVVLTGSGSAFCVGADARALDVHREADHYDPALPPDPATPGYGVRPELEADLAWQMGLRVPMIAAVNGACAGIAVALAAFCDIRFAIRDAKITTASAKLGLPAEYGLSWILPKLVGVTHAADLLLSGRIARSQELEAMGFFNAVLPAEDFERHVSDYAHMLASQSPNAVQTTKRQLWDDLLDNHPARSVETSKRLTASMMQEPDFAEGVAALLEKRPPVFRTGQRSAP